MRRKTDEVAERDQGFMAQALDLARGAEMAGEVPVGALVVTAEGEVVGRGFNRNIMDVDPSAHAEMVALRDAAWKVGNHRLLGCVLYTTIEPCAMCAGAMVQARIARLVYGADDPKCGAIRSVMKLADFPQLNHRFMVTPGVMAEACGELISKFFQHKRRLKHG